MAALTMSFISTHTPHFSLPLSSNAITKTQTLLSSSSFPLRNHPHFLSLHLKTPTTTTTRTSIFSATTTTMSMSITTGNSKEVMVLPPPLDSTSNPPPVFDGTTRLYISYTCPYAQRVWITRNCKGLEDEIELVGIDLKNRPAWYKEKVYPANKVPALEHNNEVRGESLDLIKYIDNHFEGPSLSPNDPAKKEFADVLLSYIDSFHKAVTTSFKEEGMTVEAGAAFDYIEDALSKFDDGPFLLGQFSLVDIAYAPFIERHNAFLLDVKQYDLTAGRPKLAMWIQEMNRTEGYKQTQVDPKVLVEGYKKRFLAKD